MNQKLEKTIREIGRTKAKIAELQAALPVLEKQKTELENAEVVKVFRSANVPPEDFTAFIEAVKSNIGSGAPLTARQETQINATEDFDDEN